MFNFDTIAENFKNLSSFELEEWLLLGEPSKREARAIVRELHTREARRQEIADLMF